MLWTASRKLKERIVLHEQLAERKRNKGESELRKRLEESVTTAREDLKLLREIWIEFGEMPQKSRISTRIREGLHSPCELSSRNWREEDRPPYQ